MINRVFIRLLSRWSWMGTGMILYAKSSAVRVQQTAANPAATLA
jgi:hypothetical protein